MKAVSYTPLLYGLDYLEYALRSVADAVDECHILYTPNGSFSHSTDLPCPDSKADLMKAAMKGAGRKLVWHDGEWGSEVQHRDAIYTLAPDADVYVIADADEIWGDGLAEAAVWHASEYNIKLVKVLISHYWRSFYRAIEQDAWPYVGRVINKNGEGERSIETIIPTRIHHMGYAQNSAVSYYKQFTHGHRDEWRWDWYETKWQANAQIDVHPVIHDFWNPQPVNPWNLGMPEFMKLHPYANLDLIP